MVYKNDEIKWGRWSDELNCTCSNIYYLCKHSIKPAVELRREKRRTFECFQESLAVDSVVKSVRFWHELIQPETELVAHAARQPYSLVALQVRQQT